MRSFHTEFNDLFAEGFVSAIEVGLGVSGELKYPSFSKRIGWSYPGIGEFQVSLKHSLHHIDNLPFLVFIEYCVSYVRRVLSACSIDNNCHAI